MEKLAAEVIQMAKHSERHIADLVHCEYGHDSLHVLMLPVAECNLEKYLSRLFDKPPHDAETGALYAPFRVQLLNWILCLASTLELLHLTGLVHRDMKPQNILVYGNNVLFTDFGVAYTCEKASGGLTYTTTGGDFPWVPLDAISYTENGKTEWERTDRPGDVFSLGCVFYEMLEMTTPYPLLKTRLPSRWRDDFFVYHMRLDDGGFIGDVNKTDEDAKIVQDILGAGHVQYAGLVKDLLTIVARDMIVPIEQRKDLKHVTAAMRESMQTRHFFPYLCCSAEELRYSSKTHPTQAFM